MGGLLLWLESPIQVFAAMTAANIQKIQCSLDGTLAKRVPSCVHHQAGGKPLGWDLEAVAITVYNIYNYITLENLRLMHTNQFLSS